MKYLDSHGLQKLRNADSDRMDRLYRPIGCGLWTRSESGQTVEVYPVGETKVNPTVEFRFKETPPASGTKSPSNPSTISGWTSVNAGRVGKNLLLKMASLTGGEPYVTITGNADGSYTFNGTNTSGNILYIPITDCGNLFAVNLPVKSSVVLDPSKQYTLSMEFLSGTYTPAENKNSTYAIGYSGAEGDYTYTAFPRSGKKGITLPSISGADGRFIARVNIAAESSFTDAVFRFQLEEGTTATDFETPIASSEANHVVSFGNTYYGGSIDISTGLMTVTYNGKIFNGIEEWTAGSRNGTNTYYCYIHEISPFALSDAALGAVYTTEKCTHFSILNNTNYDLQHAIAFGYRIAIFTTQTSTADFKTWLADQNTAGTPVTIAYPVVPYTVQFTPVQISSLLQKDRYTPRKNTFYTDASNLISVEYLKSPVKASYDIQQAILAQGGV